MEPSDISSSPKSHKYNTRSKNKPLDEINEVTKYKDDSDEEFNTADYHQLLSNMFPSAYMRQKAKATRSLVGKPSYNIIVAKSNGINKNKNKCKRQKLKYKDDESDEFLSDYNSDDESENDSDDESENDSSDETENDSDDETENDSDDKSENDSDDESEKDSDESEKDDENENEDDVKNKKKVG